LWSYREWRAGDCGKFFTIRRRANKRFSNVTINPKAPKSIGYGMSSR
jgi:hypothetical protein